MRRNPTVAAVTNAATYTASNAAAAGSASIPCPLAPVSVSASPVGSQCRSESWRVTTGTIASPTKRQSRSAAIATAGLRVRMPSAVAATAQTPPSRIAAMRCPASAFVLAARLDLYAWHVGATAIWWRRLRRVSTSVSVIGIMPLLLVAVAGRSGWWDERMDRPRPERGGEPVASRWSTQRRRVVPSSSVTGIHVRRWLRS